MSVPPAQVPATISFKPSAFYYRQAVREAKTKAEAQRLAFAAISELEDLKEWVRLQGMIPPKFNVLPTEAKDKGWVKGA